METKCCQVTKGKTRWVSYSYSQAPILEQTRNTLRGGEDGESGCSGKSKAPQSKQSQHGNKTEEGIKQGHTGERSFQDGRRGAEKFIWRLCYYLKLLGRENLITAKPKLFCSFSFSAILTPYP